MQEAIILAGGFGTRLRSVVSEVPKPMAPVAGRPFLSYLLDRLAAQGYMHVVLSTGYLHEKVEDFFHDAYHGISLSYARETTPLGTGGAIVNALSRCSSDEVTVLNGDTLFDIDHGAMLRFAAHHDTPLAVVLRQVDDASRYGSVLLDSEGRIADFREKSTLAAPGLINGGIYRLRRSLLSTYTVGDAFSFEREVLQQRFRDTAFYAYADGAYFIDIGIPADYARAQEELPML